MEEELEQSAPDMLYQSLEHFVNDFLVRIYNRPIGTRKTWCPQWWKHDEAVYRLQALWLAWEHMRVHDGSVSSAKWLVSYADPIMNVLFDPDGCFKGCSPERGHRLVERNPGGELPSEPADQDVLVSRE